MRMDMMTECLKAAKVQLEAAQEAVAGGDLHGYLVHMNAEAALRVRAKNVMPPPPTDDLGGSPAAASAEPMRMAA